MQLPRRRAAGGADNHLTDRCRVGVVRPAHVHQSRLRPPDNRAPLRRSAEAWRRPGSCGTRRAPGPGTVSPLRSRSVSAEAAEARRFCETRPSRLSAVGTLCIQLFVVSGGGGGGGGGGGPR